MTYFLSLMMPRLTHISESISVCIKVFGIHVELNIFSSLKKIKTGKIYLDVKRLSIEKKASIFQKILYVGLEN